MWLRACYSRRRRSGDCCGGSWIGPPCFRVRRFLGDHPGSVRDSGCQPNRNQADGCCESAAHEHIGERAVLVVGHRGHPLRISCSRTILSFPMCELSRASTPSAVSFGTPQTAQKNPHVWDFFAPMLRSAMAPEREQRWATHLR